MVKFVQEIDESARESEYCDFHVKRVLSGNVGDVEKDAVALDEEKIEIIVVGGVSTSSMTRLITS